MLIHGKIGHLERETALERLRLEKNCVLLATSLMSRGMDLKNVVLVVNYDCPMYREDFVHRVGRTGRAGAKGQAVTFVSPEDREFTREIIQVL